jgi:hypothetical protein
MVVVGTVDVFVVIFVVVAPPSPPPGPSSPVSADVLPGRTVVVGGVMVLDCVSGLVEDGGGVFLEGREEREWGWTQQEVASLLWLR